jgi:hypothetical protein
MRKEKMIDTRKTMLFSLLVLGAFLTQVSVTSAGETRNRMGGAIPELGIGSTGDNGICKSTSELFANTDQMFRNSLVAAPGVSSIQVWDSGSAYIPTMASGPTIFDSGDICWPVTGCSRPNMYRFVAGDAKLDERIEYSWSGHDFHIPTGQLGIVRQWESLRDERFAYSDIGASIAASAWPGSKVGF